MRRHAAALIVLGALAGGVAQAEAGVTALGATVPHPPQAGEVIAEVRLHGNQITPDDELLRLAGVVVGAPFTPATLEDVADRLRRTGRFQDVQVLKRFASITDPSRIVLVLIVNEGAVDIEVPDDGGPARVVRRRALTNLLVLPILLVEDGYGATYGVRLAYAGMAGRRSRLSFPLSWGGFKQAAVEFDRTFVAGPLSRVEAGRASGSRQPFSGWG